MRAAELVHFGVYCTDINKMVSFYEDVFGLKVTDRGMARIGELCFMTSSPKEHHQLVLITGRAPEQKSTVNQISFRLEKFSDLREMKAKLDAKGIAIRPIDHGCAWSLYIDDPEGNGIEIYVDAPWMIEQPYGVLMDFNNSDEILLKNTEEMVKKEPTFMTRAEWEKKIAKKFT